jgi:hypothetical protein
MTIVLIHETGARIRTYQSAAVPRIGERVQLSHKAVYEVKMVSYPIDQQRSTVVEVILK